MAAKIPEKLWPDMKKWAIAWVNLSTLNFGLQKFFVDIVNTFNSNLDTQPESPYISMFDLYLGF